MNKTNQKVLFLLGLTVIFIFPVESRALLISQCADINFVSVTSEVIVHGKVIKQEVKEQDNLINTYTDIQVDEYLKGNGNQIITVKTDGGCIRDKCLSVEDQPGFYINETGYLYLTKGEFYTSVCGLGTRNDPPPNSSFLKGITTLIPLLFTLFFKITIISVALLLFIVLIIIFLYKKAKKNKIITH